jgi:hypothetical protein
MNHIIVTIEDSSDEDYQLDINAVTQSKAKASSSTLAKSSRKPYPKPSTMYTAKADPKSPLIEPKKPPAFTYKSKAATPDAVQHIFKGILEIMVPHLTIADEHCHIH